MMNWFFSILLVFGFSTVASANCTVQVDLTETVGPVTLDNLHRVKKRAAEKGCSSIFLRINTPGGSLQTTRLIVEEILNSPIPYLCLVTPSGGHAGSAGAIILQACHVAGAMQATNLGAATPIAGSGQEMPEDLRKKMVNDTRSWMEGITKLRGRNVQFGRDIIVDAKAVSAEEAYDLKAIDFLAKRESDFLEFSKGREVKLSESTVTTVAVGPIQVFEPDLRSKALELVTDPQVAYLIFMGSLGLLYFEVTHPGTILPGVLGAMGLVVGLVSLHKLDVWWGGLLLILLGLGFMIAEAFLPSFGVLGIGGIASFFLGSLFLFDKAETGVELPLMLILVVTGMLSAVTLGLGYLAYKTFGVKTLGDEKELIGKTAVVASVNGSGTVGQVEVYGERWKFKGGPRVALGDEVRITAIKGLTLSIESIQKES